MTAKPTPTEQASSLRQAIATELARIRTSTQVFQSRSPVLRGSVYEHKINCGRPNCRRCSDGVFHRQLTLSRTENGKTVLYRVSPENRQAWEDQTKEWRAYRKAVVELKNSLRVILEAGRRLAALREVFPPKKGV